MKSRLNRRRNPMSLCRAKTGSRRSALPPPPRAVPPICSSRTFGWSGRCRAFREHLVFRGGTSLYNGYDIIQRFSEDVDLTYDIRQIIPELVTGNPPLPANNSQAKKWTETARERLKTWVKDTTLPVLAGPAVIACRRRYHCPAFGCLLNGSRDCTWSGVPPLRVGAMLTLLRVPLLILSLLSPVFTCADLLNILTLEIFRRLGVEIEHILQAGDVFAVDVRSGTYASCHKEKWR
jgi:Nucleotidyl transferase AbiEii toxin, Type IV TA system